MSLAPGDLLTVPQALKILPVGRSTLYQLIDEGRLPAFRVTTARGGRGRVLVHRRDLEAFLEGARYTAPGAPTRRVSVNADDLLAKIRRRTG